MSLIEKQSLLINSSSEISLIYLREYIYRYYVYSPIDVSPVVVFVLLADDCMALRIFPHW